MKKGFTLIELLAVIVILAIILVIAVPQILKVIENSKRDAFKVTVDNILGAANDYLTTNYREMKELKTKTFTIENGAFVGDSIPMNGRLPNSGKITINFDGSVNGIFTDNNLCAIKKKNDSEATITDDIENCKLAEPAPEVCFNVQSIGGNQIMITGYDFDNPDCPRDLIIPEKIDGGIVVGIESDAFSVFDWYKYEVRESLTSVVIPDTVEYIGSYAFYGYAEDSCTGEIESVVLPKNLQELGFAAFECNKIKKLTIPSSLEYINALAFADNQITDLTIEEGVKEIHWGAFFDNQLTNLTLPSSIEYIENAAFNNNQLPDDQAFIYYMEGGIIDNTRLISYGGAKRENVVIPNNVETIGESAFYRCQLMSVTIPNSVTSIETNVFEDNQLTSVTIPGNVTWIGPYAFYNNQLTSVTIPGNVTWIGPYAFSNNRIEELTIEEGVKEIHREAFSNNQLTSLTLPSSIEYIENAAFNNNQLPDDQAFIYYMEGGIIDNTRLISYGGAKKDNVVIPSNVRTIEHIAFYNTQLTSVTIPEGVTRINDYAFEGNQLTSITIPNSVTHIGYCAFMSNYLTIVTIGSGIETIGSYAFAYNFIPQGNLIINRTPIGINIAWTAFDNNGEDGWTSIYPEYLY